MERGCFKIKNVTAYRIIKVKQYKRGDFMKSIWEENCNFDKREALKGNIKTDILVIGAGIAGILTGYLLKQSGREVVLIDKSGTASGNTK